MTTNYHTAIATNAPDNASTIEAPLASLDAAISSIVAGTTGIVNDPLKLGTSSALTISSSAITVTHNMHTVDTAAAAADGNLDTINPTTAGRIVTLWLANASHRVHFRDVAQSTTGNIKTRDTLDVIPVGVACPVVFICDGTYWYEISGRPQHYIYIRDEETANTGAGGFTQGAWRTRVLNTEVFDTGGQASLSGNQVTLLPGTYRFKARAPGYQCGSHIVQLYNITSLATVKSGSSERSGGTNGTQTNSVVEGQFSITAAATVFEVQHQCGTTQATNGLGNPANIGVTEVYAEVEFWKIA